MYSGILTILESSIVTYLNAGKISFFIQKSKSIKISPWHRSSWFPKRSSQISKKLRLGVSENLPSLSRPIISNLIILSVRYLSDKGHSLILLSCTVKPPKHFPSGWTLGNFSSLGHFSRKKLLFNLRVLGRIWGFMQWLRNQHSSLSRSSIESWISIKFSQ